MTTLSYKKGRNGKIHIFLDDEYFMTSDETFWYSSDWFCRNEISESEKPYLEKELTFRRAFKKGVSLIERRAHGKKELERKLLKDFKKDAVEYALKELENAYLLNDKAFAEDLAEALYRSKPYGARRIRAELYKRGLSADVIDFAMKKTEQNEIERIKALIKNRYINSLTSEEQVRKTVDKLLRFGYSYQDIKNALRKISEEI